MLKKRIITAVCVTVLFGCTVFATLSACKRRGTTGENADTGWHISTGAEYSFETVTGHTGESDSITEESTSQNNTITDAGTDGTVSSGTVTDAGTVISETTPAATDAGRHGETVTSAGTQSVPGTSDTTKPPAESATDPAGTSGVISGEGEKFVFTSIKVDDNDYDYYTYLTGKKAYVPIADKKELAKHCSETVLTLDAGKKSVSYIITKNGLFDDIADRMDVLRENALKSAAPSDIYARDSYLYTELGLDYQTYYSRGMAIFMLRKIQNVTNSRGDYSVYAVYYYSYETADQMKLVDSVVKGAVSSWSGNDYDRILAAYDYLRMQCRYADNVDESMTHTAYGALVNKNAVCEGYAKAYKLLLDAMGIENDIVYNDIHAWNIVKFEDNWYVVDVTNGDVNDTYAFFMLGRDVMYSDKNCTVGDFILTSGTIAGYGYIDRSNTDIRDMADKSLMNDNALCENYVKN